MTAIRQEPEARPGRHSIDSYVPVVDLGRARNGDAASRLDLAKTLGLVCESSGFMTIVDHGVSETTVGAMYQATRRLFALPENEIRKVIALDDDPFLRGYHPIGGGVVSYSSDGDARLDADTDTALPDLVARYVVNRFGEPDAVDYLRDAPAELLLPNRWPDLAGFREAWLAYAEAMDALACDLMRLFALALHLPEEWFDDKFDHAAFNLVANYYPPQPVAPPPGQLRQGSHTDWGSLTLLYQDSAAGGLQVMDKAGAWVDVPCIPGSFVLNLGDLMAVWTNDRWVSTLHRVVNPPPDRTKHDRVSVPFFHWPNWDTSVECIPTCTGPDNPPRHHPLTPANHLANQLAAIYGN